MSSVHQALHEAGRLYAAEMLDDAEAAARQILKRHRNEADAHQLLGLIAFKRRRYDDAAAAYQRCMRLQPRVPRYVYLLGKVRIQQERFDDAIAQFDRALALDPGLTAAAAWKAVVLERVGRDDAAGAVLEPYFPNPPEAEMVEVYARLQIRAGQPDAALAAIDRFLETHDVAPLSREVLGFMRGRVLERAERYDDAFDAYARANAAVSADFDPARYRAGVDAVLSAFSPDAMRALPRAKVDGGGVVLIAGMPRSGTTLVEQVLHALPGVHGAGELRLLDDLAFNLGEHLRAEAAWPACIAELDANMATRLGRRYLDRTRRLDRRAHRIVNKSLENYKLIGLAAILLPGVRVIHVRRNPVDNGASCFFSHLMPARHAYACNLEHIALVYREHERYMEHWKTVTGVPVLDLQYEALVADLEGQSRRLAEYIEVPWDPACLTFHQQDRVALTLSYDQVREPITDRSIGRASRFGAHLDPLRHALEAP